VDVGVLLPGLLETRWYKEGKANTDAFIEKDGVEFDLALSCDVIHLHSSNCISKQVSNQAIDKDDDEYWVDHTEVEVMILVVRPILTELFIA